MSAVLTVESVSKQFKIHRNRPVSIKESIIWRLHGRHNAGNNKFWALRDVSFSLEQGKVLGIIGHNGAGKSTLLRLLCGLGRPTTGHIQRIGHVSGLLELGSGFHPDMTGRENLMTGGILSGLTRREVQARQQEIVAFAELEEFIDQPVRTYSNGMYLRLAFAAAIHFDPDVLIIDEVLAVGDARFQKRCIERLTAFRVSGKALILTSHDSEQIKSLCDEVLVLEEGHIVMQGDPASAIRCYNDLMRQRTEKRAAQLFNGVVQPSLTVERGNRMGTQEASICAVHLYDKQGNMNDTLHSGDGLTIELKYNLTASLSDMALLLGIYSETNVKCFETYIPSVNATFGPLTKQGSFSCHFQELPLLPGLYYITVGLYPVDWSYVYDYHWQMHPLHVLKSGIHSAVSGIISLCPVWSIPQENSGQAETKIRT
ncbi:MAG: Teichoic acid export ATP-binding protein TagH [Candidatus Jettenia ecosi]|uniref:Teichoic acid export ATP-binding protein TagH n=1 Tax=Candidatus Jettenia ecosi TaxID=2494326 RepID=A0A533QBC0_9BACT|nr:MAG: Teichoic acid export ATP-binding protein TagH [Candidatus Jettenia ecosi]